MGTKIRINLIVNAEAVFTRKAHSGTLSKPTGFGEHCYTNFPKDENKCNQAYDIIMLSVCVCVCVYVRVCVFSKFHISKQLTDYHKLGW
jgi:hypothetical protein